MHSSKITIAHVWAIFFIALATIAAQIIVSRILSVTVYYHFAFAGITVVMLGLTAGALKVYMAPEKFSAARANLVLVDYTTRFCFNLMAAVLLHIYIAGIAVRWFPEATFILYGSVISTPIVLISLISLCLLLRAFIQNGVCIALLLTRFPEYSGRLYAADLAGAAVGCIVVGTALMLLDPVATLLLVICAILLVVRKLLPLDAPPSLSRRWKGLTTAFIVFFVVQSYSYVAGAPAVRLLWTKAGVLNTAPFYERWTSYARVSVSNPYDGEPFGWGFGGDHSKERIKQAGLTIDAGAGTILTEFDGDVRKVAYLKDDITNLGYHFRKIEDTAVIGVGGGRDVLSGIVFGAKKIKGIEINPLIFDVLTNVYADFTGNLHKRPEVSLVMAEARSYLNSHAENYDLIQVSLIDTWAATAAGGLTLSENKLYTTDAWGDFLNRLNDNGILTLSRWYFPAEHTLEFYRLLAIGSDVIRARDVRANPRDHLLAATVNNIVTVIVSKSSITPAEIERFKKICAAHHFKILLTPNYALDEMTDIISSGKADAAYYNAQPFDISPSTDDRPFFFNNLRLSSFFGAKGFMGWGNFAVKLMLYLALFTLAVGSVCIVLPLLRIYREQRARFMGATPYIAYFAFIGIGFMLVEIAQMQHLMIFLGHPVYGLCVVLFTLLLASSFGSYLQDGVTPASRNIWLYPLLVCIVLAVVGMMMPFVTQQAKYYDTPARIAISVMMLTPMGMAMGAMFPVGVTLAQQKYAGLLPWYWGINGVGSVFASVFAVLLSLQCGISLTFWTGVACYVLCLLIILCLRGKDNT